MSYLCFKTIIVKIQFERKLSSCTVVNLNFLPFRYGIIVIGNPKILSRVSCIMKAWKAVTLEMMACCVKHILLIPFSPFLRTYQESD